MKRTVLLSLGWLVAALILYVLLVLLELYWNLYDWQPKPDSRALGLGLGLCLVLFGMWLLACASRQQAARGVSLLICLALLALAVYVFPPEPLTVGLFARERSSPLWYRAGRLVVLAAPQFLWLLGQFRGRYLPLQSGAS